MTSIAQSRSESSGLSLAVRLRRDSAEAWRDLVELYGPLVASWATRSGLSEASCEDIVQEVFLSVYRSIDRFNPSVRGATFRGWLWRITRNAVLQSLRKQHPGTIGGSTAHRQIRQIAEADWDAAEDEPLSTVDETTALLRRAMRQIKSRVEPTTWEAFFRTAVQGQATDQVAKSLGLSPAAVRQAKSRTLQRIRKLLGDQM